MKERLAPKVAHSFFGKFQNAVGAVFNAAVFKFQFHGYTSLPMIEPISLNFHSQNSGVSGGQFRFDDAAPEMNRVSPLLAPDINVARVPQCQEAFRLLKARAYQKNGASGCLRRKMHESPIFKGPARKEQGFHIQNKWNSPLPS